MRVDIVFDMYDKPYIKDCERYKRGAEGKEYIISGPEQRHPIISDALKSAFFKRDIPSFLLNECQKPAYAHCYDPKISKLSANTNHSKSLNFLRCNKEIKQGHSDIMNKETK